MGVWVNRIGKVHSSIDRSHAGRGVVSLEPTQHRDKSRGAAAMPLLSFRPRSSGLQVIAQMCPRWHRQGARAGHQEREGHRSARRQDQRHTGSARGRERHSQGGQARRPATATRRSPDRTGNAGRGIARQHRERSSRFWRRLDAPITLRLTLFACRQRGGEGRCCTQSKSV